MPPKHRICGAIPLARNLTPGAQGDDVRGLQEFLSAEGYLSANATGYFGPMTAQAVAKWQSAEGVSAVGSFGPISRERMKVWCGIADRFSAMPQRGPAPLAVTFKTNVQLANPRFVADAGDYKIVFGDGSEEKLQCSDERTFCPGPHTVTHTYSADGKYTAQLVHYGYFGPPSPEGGAPQQVVGRVQIHVGQIACTKEYKPVCGAKPIVCITTPCNPVPTTYGNRCAMEADGAKFLYAGQCRDNSGDPAKDPRCKAWYDGCNTCSRTSPDGPAMCTLMACRADMMAKPYCTAWFDDPVPGNKPPTISSFSGPTALSVNASGTWTIKASDPENGQLTYDIRWGDESDEHHAPLSGVSAREISFTQATTFTHAYAYSGTYKVTVVVRDSSGQEAKTSSTIRVGDVTTNCTMEYAPVCGLGPIACFSAHCSPTQQTYSNRCMMSADGATFIYEGACKTPPVACTADAMQCPDGSYVGRTGPNCQFVCPTSAGSGTVSSSTSCPSGYGWCPAGPAGYSCGQLSSSGQCPVVR